MMKYFRYSIIALVFVGLLVSILALPCIAEVTRLIEYNGKLSRSNGSPYPTGIYDVVFDICTDIDCSETLWTEIHTIEISGRNKKLVDDGTNYDAAFSVILGSIEPLDTLAFDIDYYLHVTEAALGYSNTEQITSAPYALRSDFSNYAETVYNSETGEYTNLQDITINEATNADTVDYIHAGSLPEANKLLALDGSGEFPNSVLKMGEGRGLDADMVDNIHASPTPEANRLLALDSSSQFPDSVIPDDITINQAKDSDKLDGYDSSYFAIASHTHSFPSPLKIASNHSNPGGPQGDITLAAGATATISVPGIDVKWVVLGGGWNHHDWLGRHGIRVTGVGNGFFTIHNGDIHGENVMSWLAIGY